MNYRADRRLLRKFLGHVLSLSAAAALTFTAVLAPAWANDDHSAAPISGSVQTKTRFLALGIGKSMIVDLPREAKDVLVADPKIATAVIRTPQRAYIIGATVGQTNIVFFDSEGQQIVAYDIAIKRDLNGLRAALKATLPNADIQIEGVGDGVMLTGTAASPIEAQQAGDLAARLTGGADK